MDSIKKIVRSLLPEPFLERRSLWKFHESQVKNLASIPDAISKIEKRWPLQPLPETNEAPIFLFASCWRSGSTLIQRIINSDGRFILWGEPFANCNLIPDLANSLRPLNESYPSSNDVITTGDFDSTDTPLSNRWTANLYPGMEDLMGAHRQFFETLFGEPAYRRNYAGWGLKEVRLSIEHALYLKWLFPNAKFVFLYRNPYKAYRSCRSWPNLFMHYPEKGVYSPKVFGEYWKLMTEGYIKESSKVGGMVIKYEDFCQEGYPLFDALQSYLQLNLNREVLTKRIGGNKKAPPIPPGELRILQRTVEPLASSLGYRPVP